jgi:hypothetical protein
MPRGQNWPTLGVTYIVFHSKTVFMCEITMSNYNVKSLDICHKAYCNRHLQMFLKLSSTKLQWTQYDFITGSTLLAWIMGEQFRVIMTLVLITATPSYQTYLHALSYGCGSWHLYLVKSPKIKLKKYISVI